MAGQGDSGGVQEAQAIGGFERGRRDHLLQILVERVGGRAGEQSALGQVERRLAGERAQNWRWRRTIGRGESQRVIILPLAGRDELQAQGGGHAIQRLAVGGDDPVRRQRHPQQTVERRSRRGVGVFERPPALVIPRLEHGAPERQRFLGKLEGAVLELLGEFLGVSLLEFRERRRRIDAPLQPRLSGQRDEPQVQRAALRRGGMSLEFAKPFFPAVDFLLSLPSMHFRFNQAEVREAFHERGIGHLALAQLPRDVEPEFIVVPRLAGPEIERRPAISPPARAERAEVAVGDRSES